MKQTLIVLLLCLSIQSTWAQARRTVDAFQMRFNMYPAGLDIEFADSDKKTINLSLGVMGSLATVGNTNEDAIIAFGFAPYADVQYRWFYKLKYEAKRGMPLKGNSGNFLALRIEGRSNPVYDLLGQATGRFSAGAVWGMQRQYTTGFHLGFEIGYGYGVDSNMKTGFVPMGNIKLGWVIFHLD